MVRVIECLQLLLLVWILKQSDAVSDQCSELHKERAGLQKDIKNIRDLKQQNEERALRCTEQLTRQNLTSQTNSRRLKEVEAAHSNLTEQLSECKTELGRSNSVENDLKKQLNSTEEVLQSDNKEQRELSSTIHGLTKTVGLLKWAAKWLCEHPKDACRYVLEDVKSGDVHIAKILFNCTNDNCTTDDQYRYTPLIRAAIYGHVEVVRVLLEGGVKIEGTDALRSTALHHGADNGHLEVCRMLLDRGAKVDSVNWWKDTPLHFAARNGHLLVVKLLVERGADVRLRNHFGQTGSEAARSEGNKNVADWLDSVSRG